MRKAFSFLLAAILLLSGSSTIATTEVHVHNENGGETGQDIQENSLTFDDHESHNEGEEYAGSEDIKTAQGDEDTEQPKPGTENIEEEVSTADSMPDDSILRREMVKTIPLAPGNSIIPIDIEELLMAEAFIMPDEITPEARTMIEGMAPYASFSQAEGMDLTETISSDPSMKLMHIQEDYNRMCVTFQKGQLTIAYTLLTDGGIMKDVMIDADGTTYKVRNMRNELLAIINESEYGTFTDALTDEEDAEFTADLKAGLVPYQGVYSIEDVRNYLANKAGINGTSAHAVAAQSQERTTVYLKPMSAYGFYPLNTSPGENVTGRSPGLGQFTENHSDSIAVQIYDTRSYHEIQSVSQLYEIGTELVEIMRFLKAAEDAFNSGWEAAGLVYDLITGSINQPVKAVYKCSYRGIYLREGSFYEHTFVRGRVEAYNFSGEIKVDYAGTMQNTNNEYEDYVWVGSELEYSRGHDRISNSTEAYGTYVAEKYHSDLVGSVGNYWKSGSNIDGGLWNGDKFPEHSCSYEPDLRIVDNKNHARYCVNGICRITNPHAYDNDCDTTCDLCGFNNEARGHEYIYPGWVSTSSGETRTCSKCNYKETRPHEYYVRSSTNATCTSSGHTNYGCRNCLYKYEVTTPALGHDLRAGACDYKYCARCSYSSGSTTHSIVSGNCNYKYCTKSGCNYTSGSQTHNMVSGNCTYKYCNKSGCSYSTGSSTHSIINGACNYVYCTRSGCGYSAGSTTHTYSSWKTTKAATCSSTGTRERTCSKCSTVQKETLAKLAHVWGSWSNYNSANHKRTCRQCGAAEYGGHYGSGNNCSACGRPKPWGTVTRIAPVS